MTAAAGLAFMVAACSTDSPLVEAEYPSDNPYPTGTLKKGGRTRSYDSSSLFGGDGIVLFGDSSDEEAGPSGGGIGVNSYLWRGALDTLSFLPLSSADPFGGVIITDWYAPPESPGERFKVTVYILDRTLRADGIRVSVFRQVQRGQGNWVDVAVSDTMNTDLENTILTRARQLRIKTLASQ